jgi:hypothetical protein
LEIAGIVGCGIRNRSWKFFVTAASMKFDHARMETNPIFAAVEKKNRYQDSVALEAVKP